MNKFMDALWDLKLRVDAYNSKDEKANRAFEVLKKFIENVEAKTEAEGRAKPDESESVKALEVLKAHTKVQDHPDTFFYRDYPEGLLIDLRYTVDTGSFTSKQDKEAIKQKNADYNLVKKALGLPEYKEN